MGRSTQGFDMSRAEERGKRKEERNGSSFKTVCFNRDTQFLLSKFSSGQFLSGQFSPGKISFGRFVVSQPVPSEFVLGQLMLGQLVLDIQNPTPITQKHLLEDHA
jgi:hypothetical protein